MSAQRDCVINSDYILIWAFGKNLHQLDRMCPEPYCAAVCIPTERREEGSDPAVCAVWRAPHGWKPGERKKPAVLP